jgi:23S rRNA pseudouridine2457 synthase
MSQLILFNKPFQVLCQFRKNDDRATLADFISIPEVYAAGRLDYDSEGLLLLTDDGALSHQLSHPKHFKDKTYWVQVEGTITDAAMLQLSQGITLNDGPTRPARVSRMESPDVWERNPPIRERKAIPTSWISLSISEGRNRQVRRMTAHCGFPTLRLIRAAVGDYPLDDLQPGEYRVITVETPEKPITRHKKTGSQNRSWADKGKIKRSGQSPRHNQPRRSRNQTT